MYRVFGCFVGMHEPWMVAIAAVLAVLTAACAFAALRRTRVAQGSMRRKWLAATAVIFGSGVWATHFVAMLAYSPGLPVAYDPFVTAASLLFGVAGAALGAGVWIYAPRKASSLFVGAFFIAAGVSGLHYVGMAGLEAPARKVWATDLVIASIILPVIFATLSGKLGRLQSQSPRLRALAIAGAVGAMTLAIVSLHFTGMGAMTLAPDPTVVTNHAGVDAATLAIIIAIVAVAVLLLGLFAAFADSRIMLGQSAQVAAEAASAAKSTFLANMSHELRTPLNAIIGYAEMLEEDLNDIGEAGAVQDAKRIQTSARHLLTLINQVLDLSKIEAGKMEVVVEDVDLAALLIEAADAIHPVAAAKGNVLDVNIDAAFGIARTDGVKLKQCVLNLLSNAVKFTDGGRVSLRADLVKGCALISIADSGIGMTEEQLARLFQPFTQADETITRRFGGTGLGLVITRHMIEMLEGEVTVRSAPGAGSTFTLRMPLRAVETLPRAA
ncbi:MAG: hypothetical protein JNM47_14405 [Hyphomonadaceae bacterium]|nr:hypothetical protein [Hyphomonadaceae bacterium]